LRYVTGHTQHFKWVVVVGGDVGVALVADVVVGGVVVVKKLRYITGIYSTSSGCFLNLMLLLLVLVLRLLLILLLPMLLLPMLL